MPDITITPTSVLRVSGPEGNGVAGEAITQGDVIYEDSSDSNKIKLTDADASEATANAKGIALNAAGTGQPITYAKDGAEVNVGGTVAVGTPYVVSGNAGKIAPASDLASSDYTTILGVGKTAANIVLNLQVSGVQVP